MRQHAGPSSASLWWAEEQAGVTNRKPPASARRSHHSNRSTLTVKGTSRVPSCATRFCDRRFHVFRHHRVVEHPRLPLDLGRHLPAQLNFQLKRVDIDAPAGIVIVARGVSLRVPSPPRRKPATLGPPK